MKPTKPTGTYGTAPTHQMAPGRHRSRRLAPHVGPPGARPGRKRAFTLLELIVVVVVLSVLALLAVPTFAGVISRSKAASAQVTMDALAKDTLALAVLSSSSGQVSVADFWAAAQETATYSSGPAPLAAAPGLAASGPTQLCVLGWAAVPSLGTSADLCPQGSSSTPWSEPSTTPGQLSVAFSVSTGSAPYTQDGTYEGTIAGAAMASSGSGYCSYLLIGPGHTYSSWVAKSAACTGSAALAGQGAQSVSTTTAAATTTTAAPKSSVTLPTPTNLVATGGDAQVSLSWSASTGATSYQVYSSTGAGYSTVPSASGGLPSGTTTTVTGLTNGTTYSFEVVALDNSGDTSSPSASASATPEAPSVLISAATGLLGYSWSPEPSVTATSTFTLDSPSYAFDNINGGGTSNGTYHGWFFPGFGSTFVSCSSLSSQAEITAVWEGQLSISSVDLQAYAGPATTETYTICGTISGGASWSQIGQATGAVPASGYVNFSIPVTSGSYDGLEVFATNVPGELTPSWIGIDQVTVNG